MQSVDQDQLIRRVTESYRLFFHGIARGGDVAMAVTTLQNRIELARRGAPPDPVDDIPAPVPALYGHGQVFAHTDGRQGMLIRVNGQTHYTFIESTREAFCLLNSLIPPDLLPLDQAVGDPSKWRPVDEEFRTAPHDGDPYGPMPQRRRR